MKLLTFLGMLLLIAHSSFAQHEKDYWIFGFHGSPANGIPIMLDFSAPSGIAPVGGTFSNSTNSSIPTDITSADNVQLGWEGTAVATHPQSGQLMFYTDGDRVYDAVHNDITPGSGLGGHPSGTQPAVILPNPDCDDDSTFYIFSNPTSSAVTGPVTYRMYNHIAGTFGPTQNLPILGTDPGNVNVTEGMILIPSSDDPLTFYLVTRTYGTANYRVYTISPSGISLPEVYTFGNPAAGVGNFAYTVQSQRSGVGAFGEFAATDAQFDNTNGMVVTTLFNASTSAAPGTRISTSPTDVVMVVDLASTTSKEVCVEYSPSGRMLYYSTSEWNAPNGNIFQYDIFLGTAAVQSLPLDQTRLSGIKLGPDGDIYYAYWTGASVNTPTATFIGRIGEPDLSAGTPAFNASIQTSYYTQSNVVGLNFPQFITMPAWSAEISSLEDSICPGQDLLIDSDIDDLGIGTLSYSWYYSADGGVTFNPVIGSTNITVNQPGIYYLEVEMANGCNILSNWLEIGESDDCCYVTAGNASLIYSSDVTITTDMAWDNKVYIADGVTVTVENAILDVTNVDVVFGECAGIDVIDGATLRANNSVFRPCDLNQTWRGIDFYVENPQADPAPTEPKGIVNECTFKNAHFAIKAHDQKQVDLRMTNNLFANCKAGVYLDKATFVRSITGNTFLIDGAIPLFEGSACSWGVVGEYFGIYSSGMTYLESITQNDFIAPAYEATNFTGFESRNGIDLSLNSNNFANTFRAILLHGEINAKVESNNIDVTHVFQGYEHQIASESCQSVLISGNEIVNTTQQGVASWSGNNSAIYCDGGQLHDIKENYIEGFETGIQLENLRNTYVTDNEINNCYIYGVYLNNPIVTSVSCNTINMELVSGGNAVGIGYFAIGESNNTTEIMTNCVFEANTAMYFEGLNVMPSNLPLLMNNYMYNYTTYGMEMVNMTGDVGSSSSPSAGAGRNSFITNNGLGVIADIATDNPPLTSFGNFGVNFVSGGVSINGNNVNSTASCGHQVDMSNSSIGGFDTCDHLSNQGDGIVAHDGLVNGYQSKLQGMSKESLIYILHTLNEKNASDVDVFYNEVSAQNLLTGNDAKWFEYNYSILAEEYATALAALVSIAPQDANEADLIEIKKIQIEANDVLSGAQIAILNEIVSSDAKHVHIAKSVLYQFGVANERTFFPTLTPKHLSNIEVQEVDQATFTVYPNPANDFVQFDYSIAEDLEAELVVYDMAGKRVAAYSLNYQHGVQNIDISSLTRGVYSLSIQTADEILAKAKMVKL